ncbi:unnamed protein product [Arabidopsis thaliana]|uniref:SWIM-type domain-containing protein n=1 Tax=Arabidopsis thaliana TaxID=3702 RepID=A0A654EGB2_ARATH|nr:unnamed protein product [Arabidopsis thaliana]
MMLRNLTESGSLSVKPASLTIFQVNTSAGASFIVDLQRKNCTCKVFDTLGIPCSHALAAARSNGTPIQDLVDDYYKINAWRSAYSAVVMPVPNAADEEVPEEVVNAERLPPQANTGPGRPRKRRIPSTGENTGITEPHAGTQYHRVMKVEGIYIAVVFDVHMKQQVNKRISAMAFENGQRVRYGKASGVWKFRRAQSKKAEDGESFLRLLVRCGSNPRSGGSRYEVDSISASMY